MQGLVVEVLIGRVVSPLGIAIDGGAAIPEEKMEND